MSMYVEMDTITGIFQITAIRARSLVVSDLRSETKGSGSSPAATYVQSWAVCSNRPANVE